MLRVLGITPEELAERLGADPVAMWRWHLGHRAASRRERLALALATAPRACLVIGWVSFAGAAALVLAGCLRGETGRPAGSPCTSSASCENDLTCMYGRCRAECSLDRDCQGDEVCVEAPGGGSGVCAVIDQGGCGSDAGPTCAPGMVCVEDACVAIYDGGGQADGGTDADADGDVEADADANPCPCDFNGDGRCGMDDFGLLQAAFGTLCPDADPCTFDLNGDRAINSDDVAIFVEQQSRPECAV